MARVTGIGGFFFRAKDPDALNRWYAEHFGVIELDSAGLRRRRLVPGPGRDGVLRLRAGLDHARPAGASSGRSTSASTTWTAWSSGCAAAGIEVEPHAEEYPNGRFAELADPEGNHVQLWEPNAASVARDPAR